MKDRMNNIDGLFKDNLYDYSSPAPDNMWQKLEADLGKKTVRMNSLGWIKAAAVILLMAGTIAVSIRFLFLSNSSESAPGFAENTTTNLPAVSNNDLTQTNQPVERITPAVPAEEKSANYIHPNRIKSAEAPESAIPDEKNFIATATQRNSVTQIKNPAGEEDILPAVSTENLLLADSRQVALNAENNTIPSYISFKAPSSINPNDIIMQKNLMELEEEKSPERGSWTIGGQAGPQYSYRDVYLNTNAYPVEDYDKYESGMLAYAGGINIEFEPASRFSIQSGLYYSKIGQVKSSLQINDQVSDIGNSWLYGENIPSRSSNVPSDLVNSTGDISFDKNYNSVAFADPGLEWEQGIVTAEQEFEFMEIPFVVKYRIIDRKLALNISSGIWANFMIGNTAVAKDNSSQSTTGTTNNINTINYSGSLSLGLGYPISSRIGISLEPFFKYYLTPINSNPETNVYPYSMGIMSGIQYSF